jgi:hypothetical protein
VLHRQGPLSLDRALGETFVGGRYTYARCRGASLRTKDTYWNDPRYRDTVTSARIYAAVLTMAYGRLPTSGTFCAMMSRTAGTRRQLVRPPGRPFAPRPDTPAV